MALGSLAMFCFTVLVVESAATTTTTTKNTPVAAQGQAQNLFQWNQPNSRNMQQMFQIPGFANLLRQFPQFSQQQQPQAAPITFLETPVAQEQPAGQSQQQFVAIPGLGTDFQNVVPNVQQIPAIPQPFSNNAQQTVDMQQPTVSTFQIIPAQQSAPLSLGLPLELPLGALPPTTPRPALVVINEQPTMPYVAPGAMPIRLIASPVQEVKPQVMSAPVQLLPNPVVTSLPAVAADVSTPAPVETVKTAAPSAASTTTTTQNPFAGLRIAQEPFNFNWLQNVFGMGSLGQQSLAASPYLNLANLLPSVNNNETTQEPAEAITTTVQPQQQGPFNVPNIQNVIPSSLLRLQQFQQQQQQQQKQPQQQQQVQRLAVGNNNLFGSFNLMPQLNRQQPQQQQQQQQQQPMPQSNWYPTFSSGLFRGAGMMAPGF